MDQSFRKTSAASLCLGSLLSIVAMALHPAGGSIDHIVRIQNVLIFSHALAIACMPVMGFGAWGLSTILQTNNRLSTLSFIVFCLGLTGGMIAATVNGLVLPRFLSHYVGTPMDESVLKAIVRYGRDVNISMAHIFIFATSVSVAIWSILIIRSAALPKWIGYFGLLLFTYEVICLFSGANFTDLYGFRIFAAGLTSWEIAAGIWIYLSALKRE